MFGQGSFINSAATTPEELARKRAEIAAMMPRFGNARYVGEGLGQLFMGIGLGRQQKALDGQEQQGRAAAEDRLKAVFGGGIQGRAQPGGFSVLGTMPMEPVSAPDPASPEGIASDAMAALGRSTYTPGDRESFVKAMMPHALRVSQETGLDPRLVIAQAAQETGWGKSAPNNNYFGIKSHGKGGGGTYATTEFVNGQPITINDSFRGYGSMGESAADYARFLQENPRYSDMLSAPDLQSQIAALGASGYATDPNYANSVASIANSIQIPGMDAAPVGGMNSPQMTAATIPTDALMSIVMDQWQPPEVRAQAQAMLDQQMKMNDPAYTMGLRADELAIRKAEAELAQMGQPQTPETLTERQALAAAGGLQPGTPEYQAFMLTGSLPGQGGDLPADFRSLQLRAEAAGLQPGTPEYQSFMQQGAGGGAPAAFIALDMQAQAAGFAPGTPEYQEFMATRGAGLSAEAATRGKAVAEADLAAPADISSAETTLNYITSLRDHPGRAAGSGASSWMGSIPGTDAREFQIEVERLKAGAFLTAIDQLKGMGALSNAEGQTATAAVAALDPNGTEEGFLKRLAEYEEIVNRGLERARKRLKPAEDGAQKTRLRFNSATQAFEPIQ